MDTIGIIGCGNMGGAIAGSLQMKVIVYDSDSRKAEQLATNKATITVVDSLQALFKECSTMLIAVKPQILSTLYPELQALGSNSKRWISIAAGIPLSVLTEKLGTHEIVRFMPNIAAQYGRAVTAVAPAEGCSASLREDSLQVASSFGSAFLLPESQFSAFIGISGSAIAYVFSFLHALAMGGVAQGIAYPQALQIANDTLKSATSLIDATKANPVELATRVCSAGGTTIEGMKALAQGGFEGLVMRAVEASSEKSKMLEEQAAKQGK
ncbi:MAG: pyrroline-5-carboxylate reductase [Spirochaetaceae bacterium]|jgi:pyrroline-5-carboxylate reductase|nr:pyrroline-5-carboxylate reductase [Spirochaetaceae bacterium]